MHVLFVHNETDYLCDAQSVFLQNLMPVLRDRGHVVELLLVTPIDPRDCPLFSWCEENQIVLYSTHSLGSMTNNIRWCVERLQQIQPDVFVAHHCYWALYASRQARVLGIPTIGVLHCDDEDTRQLLKLFGEQSPFKVDAFVAVSDDIARFAEASMPREEVFRIPCGVRYNHFFASPPAGSFKFGYFGRLVVKQKRIDEMTRAFCQLVALKPDIECHIWGDGEARLLVESIVHEYGASDRVLLHESIPNSEILAVMSEHHAIVLLSDFEGTPTSLMEGMGVGLVPLVLETGGIKQMIEDGVNGVVVQDRGASFLEKSVMLASDPILWQSLSQEARNRARKRYSVETTVDQWEAALNAVHEKGTIPLAIDTLSGSMSISVPHAFRIEGPRYFNQAIDLVIGLLARIRLVLIRLRNKTFHVQRFSE